MGIRLNRTVLNWRWWVALPLDLALLPLAVLCWMADGFGDSIAKITSGILRWVQAGAKP